MTLTIIANTNIHGSRPIGMLCIVYNAFCETFPPPKMLWTERYWVTLLEDYVFRIIGFIILPAWTLFAPDYR